MAAALPGIVRMVCAVAAMAACAPHAIDRGPSQVPSAEATASASSPIDAGEWTYQGRSCDEWLEQMRLGSVEERVVACLALASLFHDREAWSSLWRPPGRAASLAALDRDADAGGVIARRVDVLVPPLLEALADPAPEVREAAVCAVLMIGPAAGSCHARLKACLGDASPRVRAWAARALYIVCGDVVLAVDANIRLLEEPDPSIRSMAAYGLELMGEDAWPAYPFLEKRVVDEDPQVRAVIRRAMRALESANQRRERLRPDPGR